jgi:cellobiose-specific phosphotransferase system component IIA
MMGQVVSIEEFRRQRLDRELKKRIKAAQDNLAKAYTAQSDLIDELRQARPIRTEARILETMKHASYAIDERALRNWDYWRS